MKGGDVHQYRISLKKGDYCAIAVTQSTVDLAVTIAGLDGARIAEVDTPHRTTGDEVVEIVAERGGAHVVTVTVVEPDAKGGSARIAVKDIRPSTERDARRVAALRILERAEQLRGKGTADTLRASLPEYERALARFRENVDRTNEARTLSRLAGAYALLDDYTITAARYREAIELFRKLQDPAGEAEATTGLGAVLSNRRESVAERQKALELAERSGDAALQALVWLSLGAEKEDGAPNEHRTLNRALAQFRTLHDRRGEALALRLLGELVTFEQTPKAAIVIHEQAVDIARTLGDTRLEALTTGSLGFAYDIARDLPSGRAAHERALALSRQSGAIRSEARQLLSLASNTFDSVDLQSALAYARQAIPLARRAGDTDLEAIALHEAARMLAVQQGPNDESLRLFNQAADIHARNGNTSEEAVSQLAIGETYQNMGNFAPAIASKKHALDLYKEAGDLKRQGWVIESLGTAYVAIGDFKTGLEQFQTALDISLKTDDTEHQARNYRFLGDSYGFLGDQTTALDYYERTRKLAASRGDAWTEYSAISRSGAAYIALGRYEEATETYQRVLNWARTSKVPPAETAALQGLGGARRGAGDFNSSIAYLEEALVLSRRLNERLREADELNGLGESLWARGDAAPAIVRFAEALRLARERSLAGTESVALRNLMAAWRTAGRPQLAVFYGKQAVNLFQAVRMNISQLDPQMQRSYVRSKEQIYRELADLLIAEGRLPEAQQVLGFLKQEEFREYIRGGSSTDATKRLELTPEEAALEARYQEIEGQLIPLAQRSSQLVAKRSRSESEDAELERINANLKIAGQRYQAFLDSLASEFNASSDAKARVYEVREAQGLMGTLRELGPGTVALYTIVGADRYSVILVTPDIQKAATYPVAAADLARKVLAFRELLQNPASDPRPLAQELYKILVGPIARDLEQAQARTLMWSLDGVLRYVPFSALHDGRGYLVERYRSSVFTPAGDSHLKDAAGSWRSGLGVGVSKAQPGFEPLPDVAGELRGIIKDPSGNGDGVLRGRVLLDEAFTESALRAELGQEPPVVHVASHFQFRPGNEADSFLLLGDGRRLSVGELRTSWNFFKGVDLLTLSACDTAVGGAGATGKEVESFSVFAQRNGAKSVVATLWPVADTSTRVLMERFYRARMQSKGTSKAEALQTAQLALLRGDDPSSGSAGTRARRAKAAAQSASGESTSRYQHPFYWAPFLLIGNWR